MSGLNEWMEQENVGQAKLLSVMLTVDPEGSGVCRRTLYNARRSGTCDTRSMCLLIAATSRMWAHREVTRPLEMADFDQWGIFDHAGSLATA
jgi:hypothetical protein